MASVRIDGFGAATRRWLRCWPRWPVGSRIGRSQRAQCSAGPILRPVWLLAGGLAVVSSLAWTAAFAGHGAGRLTVTVLDVGQGDAILIESPDGHHVLVDGGASGLVLSERLGEELPFWERTIDPSRSRTRKKITWAGLIEAFGTLRRVRQVIASPYHGDSTVYHEWRDVIGRESYREATAGDAIDLGDGATLRAGPTAICFRRRREQRLAGAEALLAQRVVSLTGDVEVEAEDELLDSGADLHATVLKVAHHGSATSSSAAFLEAVDPALAVVSVGAHNPYGHPAPPVVQRLDAGSLVLRTDQHGTIELITDGTHLWVEAER
jgi:competence protein ComEC